MNQELKEWLIDIGTAIIIAVLILQFIMPTVVNQHSMDTTLAEGEYIFVSKKAYKWFYEPEYGDIIVFQSDLPSEGGLTNGLFGSSKGKLLVKRIIAVPGDTIEITGGKVYINGEELQEDYLKDGVTSGEIAKTEIPEGYYFCMGDNRLVSKDSRDSEVGLVSEDSIVGRVCFRLFPLKRIGRIKRFN